VTPRASVVVPVLNGAATIADMLAGLVAQAGIARADYEIIVVDGGSTDATREIVSRIPDVTLLDEPRRGPGIARDTGMRHARGAIICHLDADSLPSRRWLSSLIAPFSNPSVVVVGGKTLSFPPRTPAQRYMADSGRIDANEYIRRPVFPFVPSRNMAVRRDAALAIGGWRDEFITGEDVDFCHRLLAAYPSGMVYQPDAILLHRNRERDEELARQAWSYGEGTAHLYDAYHEETKWKMSDVAHVAGQVSGRATAAALLAVGRRLRLVTDRVAERAYYHWLWSWSFWRGFYSFRRSRAYR
jgi:glycosyltransferase involved in cell wall biosynthesis